MNLVTEIVSNFGNRYGYQGFGAGRVNNCPSYINRMSKTKKQLRRVPRALPRICRTAYTGWAKKKLQRPIADFYFRPDFSIVFLGSHCLISIRLQRDNRRKGVIGKISNGTLQFFSPTLHKETNQPGSVMEVIKRKHSTYKRPVFTFQL